MKEGEVQTDFQTFVTNCLTALTEKVDNSGGSRKLGTGGGRNGGGRLRQNQVLAGKRPDCTKD